MPQRTTQRRADRHGEDQGGNQSRGDAAGHCLREETILENRAGERESEGHAAGDAEGNRDPGQPDTFGSVMPNLPRSAWPSACASPREGSWRMRTR